MAKPKDELREAALKKGEEKRRMGAIRAVLFTIGGLVGLVLLVIAVSFLLPGTWRVERSIQIAAPPEAVHAYVGDLQTWKEWTVWNEEMDPAASWTYEGSAGQGQKMTWTGPELGDGWLRLDEADPKKGIDYTMFIFLEAKGTIHYTHTMQGTTVTWVDEGSLGYNPLYRYMGLMTEGMVGPQFEQGLATLKAKAEANKGKGKAKGKGKTKGKKR